MNSKSQFLQVFLLCCLAGWGQVALATHVGFDPGDATREVEVNGEIFPVIDFGTGPVVLMLHGWPDTKEVWRRQIPDVAAAGYRVIAPDLRGFGDAPRPLAVEAYSFPLQIGDINALLDAMGIGSAHVVGHDFGAVLAWNLVRFIPQRFTSLVTLSNGSPTPTNEGLRTIRQREKLWYTYLFLQEGIAEAEITANNFQFLRDFTDHPDIDIIVEQLSRPGALTSSLNWYRGNLQVLQTPCDGIFPPPPPPLPNVTVDVRGIWGTKDRFLRKQQMTQSRFEVEGDFEFIKIRGGGHWLMLETPELISYLIIEFLDCQEHGICY